jgi:hypothetical protein
MANKGSQLRRREHLENSDLDLNSSLDNGEQGKSIVKKGILRTLVPTSIVASTIDSGRLDLENSLDSSLDLNSSLDFDTMPNTSLHSKLPHTRPFFSLDTSSLLNFITLPLQLPHTSQALRNGLRC